MWSKKIVATPHYMKGRVQVEYSDIKDKAKELLELIKRGGLDMEIYYGKEVYYKEKLLEYYEETLKGYLFQLNTGSVSEDFGKDVKKLAFNYLKNNVYFIIGSDLLSNGNRNTYI